MRRLVPALVLIALLAPAAAAEEERWDPDRYWFADVVPPAAAWQRIVVKLQGVDRTQMMATRQRWVEEYLAAWKGDAPAAEDQLALATMFRMAERPQAALDVLGSLLADGGREPAERTKAALEMAAMLAMPRVTDELDEGAVRDRAQALVAWLGTGEGDRGSRASIWINLANQAAGEDRLEDALSWNMEAARADPGRAAQVGRSVKRLLMGSEIDLAGYEALRARAGTLFEELRELARANRDALPEDADEASRRRADAVVDLLDDAEQPFRMLGRPAPAWTLVEAYDHVKELGDLEGKVVVLDFWATWCGWCIKSFPAIRDLLRDYEEQGLVVVGVTTPHRLVYASRFDLDDDFPHKRDPGAPIRPAAVLAGGRDPGPGVPVLEEDAYRTKEKEVLATFIANHQMTWPVVMIEASEPKERYALMGWPHAVVLDRQGRVRFFKTGALLRERPEQVAHFREKIEALLAEPVEGAAADAD